MQSFVLQDWLTIRAYGGSPAFVASVPQGADSWFQNPYDDLVFYLDVKEITTPVSMNYETSPERQDSSFLAIVAPFAITGAGVIVTPALSTTAAVPASEYVRWRLTSSSSSTWDLTFRILVAGYAFG